MNIANYKIKTLLLALGILLISNFVLVYLLMQKNNKPKRSGETPLYGFVKNELKFTNAQLQSYDSIRSHHKRNMRRALDSIRLKKQAIYQNLAAQGFQDSAAALAAQQSSTLQAKAENELINSLKQIRALCTPEQLLKFDSGYSKFLFEKRQPRD